MLNVNSMITLQLLKEEVATDHGYTSWAALISEPDPEWIDIYLDTLLRRYAAYMVQHNLNRVADQLSGIPLEDEKSRFMPLMGAVSDFIRSTEIELL